MLVYGIGRGFLDAFTRILPSAATPEADLIWKKGLTAEVISAAGKAVAAGAEPLEKNGYKVALLQGVVEEELTRMGATA